MKVAMIGTGLMGFPMAERLLETAHDLIVFNRTRDKAAPLIPQGATLADDPHEAIREADLALLMLTDASAIRETLEPHGRFPDLTGCCMCQMGTIAPRESIALLEDIRRAGGEYLEAPVLGSRPQAREGKLLVMVGAEPAQFRRWRQVLDSLGSEPRLVGSVGQAAALKLAFNQLIAAELTGFATALGLIRHHQVDVGDFMTMLRQSALWAPTFDAKLPRFQSGDFDRPNFPARLLLKDLELAREVADEVGLHTSTLEGLCQLVRDTLDQGRGDSDYSVIASVVDPHQS
jgi:3-hydroxyisobutyrate dehydrogenase-like beta-hydroxyacid dehydrogenase